jgi:hypothetical protein
MCSIAQNDLLEPLSDVPLAALPPDLAAWLDAAKPLPPGVTHFARSESFGRWLAAAGLAIPFAVWAGDWLWRVASRRPWSIKESLVFGLLTGSLALWGFWYYRKGNQRNELIAAGRVRLGLIVGAAGLLWCPEGRAVTWLPRKRAGIARETKYYKSGHTYDFHFAADGETLFSLAWGDVDWSAGRGGEVADRVLAAWNLWRESGRWSPEPPPRQAEAFSDSDIGYEYLPGEPGAPSGDSDELERKDMSGLLDGAGPPPPPGFKGSMEGCDTARYLCRCLAARGYRTHVSHQPDGMTWIPVDRPITLSAAEMAPLLQQYRINEIMVDGGWRYKSGAIESAQRVSFPDWVQLSCCPDYEF